MCGTLIIELLVYRASRKEGKRTYDGVLPGR
jgi:hypothetical protein